MQSRKRTIENLKPPVAAGGTAHRSFAWRSGRHALDLRQRRVSRCWSTDFAFRRQGDLRCRRARISWSLRGSC